MRKTKVCTLALAGALLATSVAVGIGTGADKLAPQAEMSAIAFSTDNWVVKSGNIALSGGNKITTDKDADVGGNKALISTKQEYSDFHLQYKVQWDAGNTHGNPWEGAGGILLHGDKNATGPDGYYMGFYGWDNGASMYVSTGYYREGSWNFMFGNNSGWGNVGYNENTIDVYVKDSHLNVIINGWIFQNAPLPYTEKGVISVYGDGVTCSYSDFYIEPLGDDFDITASLTRANWSGSNVAGTLFYWNEAGKDQTFKMRLPDADEGATAYYLARRTKVSDQNQSVDVYVDKTGTLGLNDDWSAVAKAVTWGDKANVGQNEHTINSVEVPLSAFDGATPGGYASIYLDKNVNGWYSAGEYWLLYKDKNGVLRVADYLDLAYQFDKTAHGFAAAEQNSYFPGYYFIHQDKELITSHRRGQEVAWLKYPTATAIGDVAYDFEYDEESTEINIADYIDVQTNHYKCNVEYLLDGQPCGSTVTLPAVNASGKITVNVTPKGVANDNSGNVTFPSVSAEISYTTTYSSDYLRKKKDISVNSVGEGGTIDLKDYVDTNIEGSYSYTYDGNTVQGSTFAIPAQNVSDGTVTVTVTPVGGAAKSVELALDVKRYEYPAAVALPFYEACGQPGSAWLPLYGTVKAEGGKWVSDSQNVWGVLADFGTDNYAFRTRLDIKESEKNTYDYGILLHASIGTGGYNGLLLQFNTKNGGVHVTSGWLIDGKFVMLQEFYTNFNVTGDFYVTIVSSGSAVELMLNGWRVCEIADRYFDGGKIALLGGGAANVFSDMQCDAFVDNIADKVLRYDWNPLGSDTFAKECVWNGPFSVTFDLPTASGAQNYKLVARTFCNGKTTNVSAGGKTYSWTVPTGNNYGDAALALDGLAPSGERITFDFTPTGGFDASFMTLLYEVGGVEYIADSVYFAYAADAASHGVTEANEINDRKMYIPLANGHLLTARKGEKAVWARRTVLSDYMQAKTYSDATVSPAVTLPYRLYLPQGYDESKKYPLMLFTHGAGERGADNALQVDQIGTVNNVLLERLVLGGYNDRFIVVAPQCPIDMRWVEYDWTSGEYSLDGIEQSIPSKLVLSLMYNEIFANYSVDRSRVYGAGVSMGGFGITDLAMRCPDMFAAIINVCGGCDPTKADLISTTAVRGYHSPTDGVVNYEPLKDLLSAAAQKGYAAEYHEINVNIGHAEWVTAFEEPDLISWLLTHEKTWTVSVELNGGTLEAGVTLPQTYGYAAETVTLPTPSRDGYTFGGWYTNSAFTGEPITSFSGAAARNLTLFARWEKDAVVTVKSDDEVLATESVKTGTEFDLSQFKPTKTGYILVGWTDGTNSYSVKGKITVYDDVTVTAVWQKAVYTVTVYFGDEKIFDKNVEYGGAITFMQVAIEGYTFDGLYSDAELTVRAIMPATAVGDVTLYAKYVKDQTPPPAVTELDVVINGSAATVTVGEDGKLTYSAPAVEGKRFVGLFVDAQFTTPATAQNIASGMTLYAKYEDVPAQSGENNGGENNGGDGVDLGLAVGLPLGIVGAAAVGAVAFVLIRKKRKQSPSAEKDNADTDKE